MPFSMRYRDDSGSFVDRHSRNGSTLALSENGTVSNSERSRSRISESSNRALIEEERILHPDLASNGANGPASESMQPLESILGTSPACSRTSSIDSLDSISIHSLESRAESLNDSLFNFATDSTVSEPQSLSAAPALRNSSKETIAGYFSDSLEDGAEADDESASTSSEDSTTLSDLVRTSEPLPYNAVLEYFGVIGGPRVCHRMLPRFSPPTPRLTGQDEWLLQQPITALSLDDTSPAPPTPGSPEPFLKISAIERVVRMADDLRRGQEEFAISFFGNRRGVPCSRK